MAARRTYYGLTVNRNIKQVTIDIDEIVMYNHHYSRSKESELNSLESWMKIIENNTGLNYPEFRDRINSRGARGLEIEEILMLLHIVLVLMQMMKHYREAENRVEVCPRIDYDNCGPGHISLAIMIRYYEDEDRDVFDRYLRTYFEVERVEETG